VSLNVRFVMPPVRLNANLRKLRAMWRIMLGNESKQRGGTLRKMAKRDAIAAKARRDAKTRVMKGGGGGGFAALGDLGQRAQKVNQYMVGGYPAAPFGIGGQRPREKRRRRKNNQGKKSKNRRRSRRRPPQPRSFLI